MNEKVFRETMETLVAKMIHSQGSAGRETIKYREHFHLHPGWLSRTIASSWPARAALAANHTHTRSGSRLCSENVKEA